MSRIAVVGAGSAGLGTAIALASLGHRVVCVEKDPGRLDMIVRGEPPFFEENLAPKLRRLVREGLLSATADANGAVRGAAFIFLCVGTPAGPGGSMDTSQLESAASAVATGLRRKPRQTVVVKSTVVPGTTEAFVIPIVARISGLPVGDFGVCVNPEFLREGKAVHDSLYPTHLVAGESDRRAGSALLRLYAPFRCPKIRTSLRVAEAIKYATNAFLATKVTFANELANICTRLGLDSDEVLRGMSFDPRINPNYLVPGVGFGGSCLPKDLRALLSLARRHDYEPILLGSVRRSNSNQPLEAIRLLEAEVGTITGKRIALLGLAFKPGTDDVRESKAIDLVRALEKAGAQVIGYDPLANESFRRLIPELRVAKTTADALEAADACIIHTPWPEFVSLGTKDFQRMASPIVIDARRTWSKDKVPKGIRYRRIG